LTIPGFGEERARSVADYFRDERQRDLVARLRAHGVDPVAERTGAVEGPLSGKSICVTGTLSVPRSEAQRRIEAAGGKFASAVSKTTSYVVAGGEAGGAKLEKAQKLGVPVIDEAGLWEMIGEGG
jgi:DNA ligase (NAD+)